jgi:hypothetical protein
LYANYNLPMPFTKQTKFSSTSAGKKLPHNWVGKQAYTIAAEGTKKQKQFILVPFADAGQKSTPQQVWIPVSNETTKK